MNAKLLVAMATLTHSLACTHHGPDSHADVIEAHTAAGAGAGEAVDGGAIGMLPSGSDDESLPLPREPLADGTPMADDGTVAQLQCPLELGCAPELCDPIAGRCLECRDDDDCGDSYCEAQTHECVECRSNEDCAEVSASTCVEGRCEGCAGDSSQCAHLAGTTVCAGDQCVQCTGTEYDGCASESGEAFVCDSQSRACSEHVTGSSGLCQQCVSDAQCAPGQLCVLQIFDGAENGHFCLWKKGAGVGHAPDSCPDARPYVETAELVSIDGVRADVCTLRSSTCPARETFSSPDLDCAPLGRPDDTLCGAEGVSDAYCRLLAQDPDVYRCTMPCGSADDCPIGFDCQLGTSPPTCEL